MTNIKKEKTRNRKYHWILCVARINYGYKTCILCIMIKIQFSEGWNKTSWKSVALLCNHYYSLRVNGTHEEASIPPGSYDLSLYQSMKTCQPGFLWLNIIKIPQHEEGLRICRRTIFQGTLYLSFFVSLPLLLLPPCPKNCVINSIRVSFPLRTLVINKLVEKVCFP